MEEMNKAYFQKLARQLMFDVSDEEAEQLQEEFKILNKQIALLEKIDTENTEPMIYPFEAETTFLREDQITQTISREDALKNVKAVMAGHVHVPKVVK